MNKQFWLRTFAATTIMLVADLAFSPTQPRGYTLNHALWDALSNLMISFTMNLVVNKSHLHGQRLAISVWLIAFVIGTFNILIEAWIFNVTNTLQTLLAMLHGAVKFALMAIVIIRLYPEKKEKLPEIAPAERRVFPWFGRTLAGIALYIFFYIVAGMILQASLPAINEYYQDKLPPLNVILYTQVFRGLVFVMTAVFFQHVCIHSSKTRQAMLLGLIFSVLGGIAPLLPPNNFMPPLVRLGHGFEVGISNWLFGYLLMLIVYRATTSKSTKTILHESTRPTSSGG